jgi:4-hydroxy-2-oxoheptanedioate aldolase
MLDEEIIMKNIKSALDAGEVLIGPFSVSGSPNLVEMIGYAGFDFVIIDCEHASTSPWGFEIEGLIRAAYAADIAPIVRVTNNDRGQILKAFNLGAPVVIVPHVNTVADAKHIVESGKYAPTGRRSCAPPVRAAKHGFISWSEFYRKQLEETLLFPLIEEVKGVENVKEIAQVKGLGGIFFGPFDLAVSKGNPDSAFDPSTHDQREYVYTAAKECGLPIADLAWDLESAEMMIGMGAQLIALGTDLTMFADSLRSLRKGVISILNRLNLIHK